MKKSTKILKLSDELHELITKLAQSRLRTRGRIPRARPAPHAPHLPRPTAPRISEPPRATTEPSRRSILRERILERRAPVQRPPKFPEGFNLEKAPALKGSLNEGLRLQIDKKTNTFAIDPVTKSLKIDKLPREWIENGNIKPEFKGIIKQIKKELVSNAKESRLFEATQKKIIKSFHRAQILQMFKDKLPARAAAGVAVLTGVAGLYFAFSGKSTVPNATPEQSKFISQVLNTPSIASVPPAQPTIASINKLISDLNKIKSGKTSQKTIQFINSNVSALQNLAKALEPMSSLQSPDPGSIASYRKDAMTLKMQINTFNSMAEELKSKLESSNQTALVSEVEDIQSTLYTYNNLIDQAMQ